MHYRRRGAHPLARPIIEVLVPARSTASRLLELDIKVQEAALRLRQSPGEDKKREEEEQRMQDMEAERTRIDLV